MGQELLIPKTALIPGSRLDIAHVSRFSAHLRSIGEPPLLSHLRESSLDECLRISYFPCFSRLITLRIERRGQNRWLFVVLGQGPAGYEPTGVHTRWKSKLPAALWWKVVQWRDTKELWVPGALRKFLPDGTEYASTDGHEWLFEFADRRSYRASTDHCPSRAQWLEFEAWFFATLPTLGIDSFMQECRND
jgi:hypothetical protein